MDLEFTVLHDPNLQLFAIAERIVVDKATDEAGHSLLDPSPAPDADLKPAGNRPWNPGHATATLAYPPQTSQRLAQLRGHLDIEVITKSEAFPIIKKGRSTPSTGKNPANWNMPSTISEKPKKPPRSRSNSAGPAREAPRKNGSKSIPAKIVSTRTTTRLFPGRAADERVQRKPPRILRHPHHPPNCKRRQQKRQ